MKNWGFIGVFLLFAFSSIRLAINVIDFFNQGPVLKNEYWVGYTCTCILFLFGEGRVLHKKFNPFVITRYKELCDRSDLTIKSWIFFQIFAPLYCMGHINSPRKIKAWISTIVIFIMAKAIQYLPDLCRAAICSGVALSLSFASISLIYLRVSSSFF